MSKLNKNWILHHKGYQLNPNDNEAFQKFVYIYNRPMAAICNTSRILSLGIEQYVTETKILKNAKIFIWEPLSNSYIYLNDIDELNFLRRVLLKILKGVDKIRNDYTRSSFEVLSHFKHEIHENETKKTISVEISTEPKIFIFSDIEKKEKYGPIRNSFGIFCKIETSKGKNTYKFHFLNRRMIINSLEGLLMASKFVEVWKGKNLESFESDEMNEETRKFISKSERLEIEESFLHI